MENQWLKEKLGEALYAQVAEKLGEDIQMVPKTRLDEALKARDDHKAATVERDKQLAELQKQLTAGADAVKLVGEMRDQLAVKDKEMQTARKDAALQLALIQAKARNPKAVKALLDTEKFELQEDGSLSGIAETLDAIRKTDAYLFDDMPGGTGSKGGFARQETTAPNLEQTVTAAINGQL